jgi:large subunit ribosomal protein L22
MQDTAKAIARFLQYSPFKLRPLADVVRGHSVEYALNWLSVCALRRAAPLKKLIASAAANAKSFNPNVALSDLYITDIRVDHGPSRRYFKPGAMGRAGLQRKRLSHASVVVKVKGQKEV